jgi:molybdopterin-guanine dinucleotide biosynthesis protein A
VPAMAAFTGAVLTGGASRRMGTDKAFVTVEGAPLVGRVAGALTGAGAAEVMTVGGDLTGLRALGLDARPDPRQGDGPLGGLLTALELAAHPVVVVLATDLVALTASVVTALVDALHSDDTAGVAAARTDRVEPLCAAWRTAHCLAALRAAHGAGERAVHRAMAGLARVDVPVDPRWLRNVNNPADLADDDRATPADR